MEDVTIMQAGMRKEEDGFRGQVVFAIAGHKQQYEVSLFSKNSTMWDYSLNFDSESGVEAEIEAVEIRLEEDDELFDALIDAAMEQLQDPTN